MSLTTQSCRVGPVLVSSLPANIPIDFPFQDEGDLVVLNLGQTITPIGTPVTLVLNSDYTVNGGGYDASYDMQTGSIDAVSGGTGGVAAGDYLVVIRNPAVNQQTSFLSTGLLTGQMIEAALDKQATLSQFLGDGVMRSMRAPLGEDLDWTLPSAEDRAASFPYFDSLGDLTTYTLADILAALEAGDAPVDANLVYAGPASGAAASASFRALVAADFTGLTGFALAGAVGSSLLTMATARLLGRTTGGTGAIESMTVGTSLTLAAGSLDTVQSILTTSEVAFKRTTLTRTDNDFQIVLASATRSFGIAVAGTQFQIDDMTAAAARFVIDGSGVCYLLNLSTGGLVKADAGTGALTVITAIDGYAIGSVTPSSGAFTTLKTSGNMTIGGATIYSVYGLLVQSPIAGTGVAIYNQAVFTAGANSETFVGFQNSVTYAKGAYTGLTAMNFRLGTPTASGAGTIANAYQIYIDAGVAATNTYGIYQAGTDLNVFGGLVSVAGSTPASAAASGVAGTVTWDASYVYVCTASNTWKRAAIATW